MKKTKLIVVYQPGSKQDNDTIAAFLYENMPKDFIIMVMTSDNPSVEVFNLANCRRIKANRIEGLIKELQRNKNDKA